MVLHLECDLFLVRNLLDRPVVFVKLQYCPVQQVMIARTRRRLGEATIPLVALSTHHRLLRDGIARSVAPETTGTSTATEAQLTIQMYCTGPPLAGCTSKTALAWAFVTVAAPMESGETTK